MWTNYNIGTSTLDKMRSCYNRRIQLFFFGFKRQDSLMNILVTLGLLSCDTTLAMLLPLPNFTSVGVWVYGPRTLKIWNFANIIDLRGVSLARFLQNL